MSIFREDTLTDFQKVTGFNIIEFITNFIKFNQTQKNDIVAYYSGDTQSLNSQSFDILFQLQRDVEQAITLMIMNKNSFHSFADWNLLEQLETLQNQLKTIENSSKWLRSVITKNSFNSNPEVSITLGQGETLEHLVKDQLGSLNYENDWIKIAIRNDLKEEDYGFDGGNLLQVQFENQNFFISGVVDNIQGEKVLGLDLYKKLTFEDDDLKVLSYQDTFKQAVLILSSLKQGDNPEFLLEGVSGSLVVGTNLKSLAFPSLFRQMSNTFSKDDTMKGFKVKDLSHEQDSANIEIEVESRLGDLLPATLTI